MAYFQCGLGGSGVFCPSDDGVQYTTEFTILPFTMNANYRIKTEFYVPTYVNNMTIVGNSGYNSYSWFNLTQWQNAYGFGSGRGDGTTYSTNAELTGWHTFDFNNSGYVYFDEVQVVDGSSNPIVVSPLDNANLRYTIGYRDTVDLTGKIKRFTIWDNTDDSLVCDLQAYGFNGSADCLLDVVNGKIYTPWARGI